MQFLKNRNIYYQKISLMGLCNPKIVKNDYFWHHFSVNLWARIIEGKLIGLFGLPERFEGEDY